MYRGMASVQIAWDGGIPAGNQWVLMDGQTAIYSKELHKGGSVSRQPVMSHMGWTPFSKKNHNSTILYKTQKSVHYPRVCATWLNGIWKKDQFIRCNNKPWMNAKIPISLSSSTPRLGVIIRILKTMGIEIGLFLEQIK